MISDHSNYISDIKSTIIQIAHNRKCLISVFQEFSTSIKKTFFFGRETGH